MNRRRVLLGIGAALSLGLGDRGGRDSTRPIAVRIWQTEDAASYPASRERAVTLLRETLGTIGHDLEITFGARPLEFDVGDQELERRVWPRRVLAGVTRTTSIDPVWDVNLLLTDGDVFRPTAGYAYDHIATVPGARHLNELATGTPTVVDYSVPGAVAQLLLHEVGHALGLDHEHGSITLEASTITVSPMVGGYAWASDAVRSAALDGTRFGAPPPTATERERRLQLSYSQCARTTLEAYRGSLVS